MSLCESPLTLIEEAAHGSRRSCILWGGVYMSPSVFMCVYVWRWDMLSSKPVRTSTWPLRPVLCVVFFWVIGSHNSAFSRWFPAGLRMTCDNITVLKGQAWREPVGGLGQSHSGQTSKTVICTQYYAVYVPYVQKRKPFMDFQTPSIEHISNKAMQIFTVLLEPRWPESQSQAGCRNVCMLIKPLFVFLQ